MVALARATKTTVEGMIVFTDIVGFTEFTALRGDDEALALLSKQDEVVDAALPEDARVVKELGDGLLLWFPEAVGALRTAFVLQRRFEQESTATGAPLWVRMGLHHGNARRRGDDLIGHDVNVAARIVGIAGPGEVLLSDAARRCVGLELPGICFDELGPVVMKGIPEPVRLWRASPSRQRA
jgi:adenylate cyclase